MNGKFVTYYRVSRASQGVDGLGMEAQERAVETFLNGGAWEVIESFKEVESGKNSDRPELAKAIALCKATGAKLLIAKLDRLARDIRFLTILDDHKVEFVCADMPDATRMTIGILMVVAQAEREAISSRTKAGLESIKARIVAEGHHVSKKGNVITRLGGPSVFTDDQRALGRAKRKTKADERAIMVGPTIKLVRQAGGTLQDAADHLNQLKVTTARGKQWTPASIKRVEDRLKEMDLGKEPDSQ